MPIEFPDNLGDFHELLKQRIRDQEAIDEYHDQVSVDRKVDPKRKMMDGIQSSRHTVGQTGCFCMDCLVHRKQEWRIGDVNTTIVGPRDQWQQYTWGNAERMALFTETETAVIHPTLTPSINEIVKIKTAKQKELEIEREAKFLNVASGKYHTLMLSESASVFACGDSSYGALGIPMDQCQTFASQPAKVDNGVFAVKGRVETIAATGYSSYALVVLPVPDMKTRQTTSDTRPRHAVEESKRVLIRRQSVDMMGLNRLRIDDNKDKFTYNILFSWGRGDCGVLGHGDAKTSSLPRSINFFSSMRVLQVSAGLQHVLVLTELDGTFAFGEGSHGKLGVGDLENRYSPVRVQGLDGLNVAHVSAGDDHSIVMTGETFFNRQVYSWGLGKNGRLGHNDEQSRLKPTRINFFRGRKVVTVAAGGAHNLATSETTSGICVWSWGCGAYGQLGHRDTWDALLPRSIDEIRRESIRYIDAGERHSLAISESRQLWLWGHGVHGSFEVAEPDLPSTSLLQPTIVDLPDIHLISAKAGRGRTYVWGDRAIERQNKPRPFGGTAVAELCCALEEHESLTSDSFRILYRCGPCKIDALCIACAHRCHIQHCLELKWTTSNALSRECDCFYSGKCTFDNDGGRQEDSD